MLRPAYTCSNLVYLDSCATSAYHVLYGHWHTSLPTPTNTGAPLTMLGEGLHSRRWDSTSLGDVGLSCRPCHLRHPVETCTPHNPWRPSPLTTLPPATCVTIPPSPASLLPCTRGPSRHDHLSYRPAPSRPAPPAAQASPTAAHLCHRRQQHFDKHRELLEVACFGRDVLDVCAAVQHNSQQAASPTHSAAHCPVTVTSDAQLA